MTDPYATLAPTYGPIVDRAVPATPPQPCRYLVTITGYAVADTPAAAVNTVIEQTIDGATFVRVEAVA